ncbi:MAG: chloride channel protein [Archaeoglobus sp.]|nr:chloride channel protein [Archaeoglobus sp.]
MADVVKFNLLAIVTGVTCGFIAIGFRYLIFGFNDLFFNGLGSLLSFISPYYLVLIPAIGGIFVGILTYYFAPEAKGHGVPEVMNAVALQGGRIRPRVVAVKALASSICIGSGGSAGREGPIVQMGSATGSTIAQLLRLTPYQTKILVACGAAGGIAGTFNTPIAGVLFSLELIIRELKIRSFAPIVISSVFATIVSRILLRLLGVKTAFVFEVPPYTLNTPYEIFFYLFLGILAGIVALTYTKTLYRIEDFFEAIKIPEFVKPSIGGFIVGIIGLIVFLTTGKTHTFGVGYESIELLFKGNLVFEVVLALVFLKIIATSITLGSGGSGGIFAPSLFIGSMLGAAYGMILQMFFPTIVSNYVAYAIVGMAAVFAGASRATLTSIIIVFEMTGDYAIILPLMFACVISCTFFSIFSEDTIYTLKLRRRGIIIEQEMDINLMRTIRVKDIMKKDVDTVREDTPVSELSRRMTKTGHMGFPVVRDGKLVGIVTHSDFENIADTRGLYVLDIMTTDVIKAYPDETLEDVIMKAAGKDVSHFPVVDPADDSRLIGFFTKGDIIRAYTKKRME